MLIVYIHFLKQADQSNDSYNGFHQAICNLCSSHQILQVAVHDAVGFTQHFAVAFATHEPQL